MVRKNIMDFDISGIVDNRDKSDIFKDRLKGSKHLSKIFLLLCHMTIKEEMKHILTKDVASRMSLNPDMVRRYLEDMTDNNVVLIVASYKGNPHTARTHGKSKIYILNLNHGYYKQFIPIAREVLGI